VGQVEFPLAGRKSRKSCRVDVRLGGLPRHG
jgi:hypothetical protein